LLFAAWSCVRAMEARGVARDALAVIATGLALAGLQNGVFALAPLGLALGRGARSVPRGLARGVAGVLLALLVALPFQSSLPFVDADGVHLAREGGHVLAWDALDGRGVARSIEHLFGHAPVLWALACAGLVLAAGSRRARSDATGARTPAAAVLAALALPCALVCALDANVQERFLLPLVPIGAMLAASLLARVPARLAAAVWALALAFPLACALRFVLLSRTDDTLERACAVLAEHGDETVVAEPGLTLPIVPGAAELADALAHGEAERSFWPATLARFEARLDPARRGATWTFPWELAASATAARAELEAELAKHRPCVVVLTNRRSNAFLARYADFRAIVERDGERVAAVHASTDPERRAPHPYQGQHRLALALFGLDAFGPDVELWRLPAITLR
ncbi:MAG: hypothetical protein HZA53_06895, partial [Planctomycetes bacterium]|nr:hypothetical protein [Planctomycetota bacterium]